MAENIPIQDGDDSSEDEDSRLPVGPQKGTRPRYGNGGSPGGNGGVQHNTSSVMQQHYIAEEAILTEDFFEFLEDNYRRVNSAASAVSTGIHGGGVQEVTPPTYRADDGRNLPEEVAFSLDGPYNIVLSQHTYIPPEAQAGAEDVDDVDTSNYEISLVIQGERGADPLDLGDILSDFEDEYGDILEELDVEEEAARMQKAQLEAQIKAQMGMMGEDMADESFVEQHLTDVSGKTWDDIVLPEETEEKVKTMAVRPQTYPEAYERFDRNPNAILLYGQPGTGKTETGRIIASETDSPFLYMSVADFTNKYVGETSDRIKEVFEYVREEGAVLFLDEAEGLMGKRSASPSDGGGQVRNEMVQTLNRELSGMDDLHDGLVIAATNLEEGMDEAVIRDERFDHRIPVKPPQTAEERAEIFRIHTADDGFGDLDYDRLGELTEDYTGATIKGTIDRAVDKQLQTSIVEAEEGQGVGAGEADIDPDDIVVQQEDIEAVIEENREDVLNQNEEADVSEAGFGA